MALPSLWKATVSVLAVWAWPKHVACSAGTSNALEFDFVIIGGGTSGLVIANRLSELPHITVAVIEPGDEQRTNPNVTSVNNFPLALDSDIDWKYSSVPQTHAGGRVIQYNAGKAIGGTSTINGQYYLSSLMAVSQSSS
jgi:choline dehydrogenase-like flavoprotein